MVLTRGGIRKGLKKAPKLSNLIENSETSGANSTPVERAPDAANAITESENYKEFIDALCSVRGQHDTQPKQVEVEQRPPNSPQPHSSVDSTRVDAAEINENHRPNTLHNDDVCNTISASEYAPIVAAAAACKEPCTTGDAAGYPYPQQGQQERHTTLSSLLTNEEELYAMFGNGAGPTINKDAGSDRMAALGFIMDAIASTNEDMNTATQQETNSNLQKYPETPVALRTRAVTYRFLPQSAHGVWIAVVKRTLTEYSKARIAGDRDKRMSVICELLSLPSKLLTRLCQPKMLKQQILRGGTSTKGTNRQSEHNNSTKLIPGHINRCIAYAMEGDLGRAARAISEDHRIAPMTKPTIEKLQALHPRRINDIPFQDETTDPIIQGSTEQLAKLIKAKCNNVAAGGPSGWTNKLLLPLAGDLETVELLAQLLTDIANGSVYGEAAIRLKARTALALYKDESQNSIRPIGQCESIMRLASQYALQRANIPLDDVFHSIQYGVACRAGVERVAHMLRASLRTSAPHTVICSTDIRNAFNTIPRKQVYEMLLRHNRCKQLIPLFRLAYDEPALLCCYDKSQLAGIVYSDEGVVQGDPLSSFLFAATMQPIFEAVSNNNMVQALAILDDFYLIGNITGVMKAVHDLKISLQRMDMELCIPKCKVIQCDGNDDAMTNDIRQMAMINGVAFTHTLEPLGTCISTQSDGEEKFCLEKVKDLKRFIKRIQHPALPPQIFLRLLQISALSRLVYMARTTHPNNILPAARTFDAMVLEAVCLVLQLPKDNERITKLTRLPIRHGGLGVLGLEQISLPAYMSSLVSTLLHRNDKTPSLAWTAQDSYNYQQLTLLRSMFEESEAHVQLCMTESGNVQATIDNQPIDQASITDAQHIATIKKFKDAYGAKYEAARLSSSAKYASRWLHVPIADKNSIIPSPIFLQAIRTRLSLPPVDVAEACCPQKHKEKIMFAEHPMHAHDCSHWKRRTISTRHNLIVNLLAKFAKDNYLIARADEPIIDGTSLRVDLTIETSRTVYWIDVAITNPTSIESLRYSAATKPLAAAHRYASKKIAKYQTAISKLNIEYSNVFVPFVLEVNGGISANAQQFIRNICNECSEPAVARKTLHNLLSVTLQVGNGLIGAAARRWIGQPLDSEDQDEDNEEFSSKMMHHANKKAMRAMREFVTLAKAVGVDGPPGMREENEAEPSSQETSSEERSGPPV